MVFACLVWVFVHSRFTENPTIDLEATNPSFLRWLSQRPGIIVPCTYLNILLTALIWLVVGPYKNRQTLFTEKDKSVLVRVRYCKPPMIL
jgi:hypothetical protein